MDNERKCTGKTLVYSRIVGYFSPVDEWNIGKKEEWIERNTYEVKDNE